MRVPLLLCLDRPVTSEHGRRNSALLHFYVALVANGFHRLLDLLLATLLLPWLVLLATLLPWLLLTSPTLLLLDGLPVNLFKCLALAVPLYILELTAALLELLLEL
jgi:hypothetical protein